MVFWIASFLTQSQHCSSLWCLRKGGVPFVGILGAAAAVSSGQLSGVASRGNAYTRPALSSNVSPFLGGAKAPLILLTAICMLQSQAPIPYSDPSCTSDVVSWLQRPRSCFRSRRNRCVWCSGTVGGREQSLRGGQRRKCGQVVAKVQLRRTPGVIDVQGQMHARRRSVRFLAS